MNTSLREDTTHITGSALGLGASSLRKRVARHLQRRKHKFWHIDYFLARKDAIVIAIIAARTDQRMECEINKHLRNELKARIPVLGFGASDCKENCESHLLCFGEKSVKQKITAVYNENFGSTTMVVDC